MENSVDTFDYTSLFDLDNESETIIEEVKNPNQDAIDFCLLLLDRAKKDLEYWSNKTYKSCGNKSVFVGSEMEGVNVSINRINAKRIEGGIKNAKKDIAILEHDLNILQNSKIYLEGYATK